MPAPFWKGLGMGRKLSLTNLTAMAVVNSQDSLHHPVDSSGPSFPPSSPMSHLSPPISSSNSLSLLQLPHPQHSQQQGQVQGQGQGQEPQRLSSPISFSNESDVLSVHSSVLATAASTPFQSPHSVGSDVGTSCAREFSPSSISIPQQPLSAIRYQSSSSSRGGATPSASNSKAGATRTTTKATTATTEALDPSSSATQIHTAINDKFLASPYVSSNSLSSSFLGTDLSPQATTINTTAATNADGAPTATTTPTTIATTTTFSSSSSSSFRPRSRATDLLLNLEASSNDARFQEILHNTIALDLFRQFCFQEYSIENLLFWMDVELFAKPNLEMQRADRLKHKILQRRLEKQQRAYRQEDSCDDSNKEPHSLNEKQSPKSPCAQEKFELDEEELVVLKREVGEEDAEFAVQHARYIYLTYIDTYAPLQVNLSDESRTDIPWPILDPNDPNEINDSRSHSRNNSGGSAKSSGKKSSKSGSGGSRTTEVFGWPLDRHMFDGAQEHTYQLMKGHTLVRFEDSELWKSAQRMMHDQPGEYEKAIVHGPLHTHYCPDSSVILSTVARSRSRHPTAKLQTLYNWNNSTTDLDRSRDKEEALAKTMSQYFGPIPHSIRHPGRVILGLGPRHHGVGDDDLYDEDEFDDFDTFEEHVHGNSSGPHQMTGTITESKRSLSSSSIAGGLGSGFRKNRFTKRLSGGGRNNSKSQQHHSNASDEFVPGDLYDDACSLDHNLSHEGVDTVANGRRTTRWMVAGYFNDQVRLTAAQRKRLLRRNNKLTKFFGSRVDGTLRPVEETEDGGFIVPPSSRSSAAGGVGSLATVGPNGVPALGSPLAYALSSSTIHDIDRKGRPKKNKSKRDSGNGHEVLFPFPGASSKSAGSRSLNILQKFKRSSGEYYDSNNSQTRSSLFLNTANNGRKSASQDDIGTGSGSSRHVRSATSVDVHLPAGRRILAAHPHPLWSGSLSDHEVDSPAGYERRRQLSILSIMGNGLNNNSSTSPHSPLPSGLTPTTPTRGGLEFYASPHGLDQDGTLSAGRPAHPSVAGSLDRHVMYTRRKKADKLSTFFGAQLTAQELSSQLHMDDDFGLVSSTIQATSTTAQQSQDQEKIKKKKNDQLQRSLSESDKHKVKPAVMDPTILSVNQLSHRDRTLLWKRNKKLRGILGESLQENEVALSLTIPVLMESSTRTRNSMSSSRRTSAASPSLRKKRSAGSSLHAKQQQVSTETRTGDDEDEEYEDGEGEDDSEGYEDLNSSSNLVRPKIAGKGGNKTRGRRASTTNPTGARARRSSVASNASGIPGNLTRAMSIQSLDSFMTIDTVLDEDLDGDLRETEEELGIPLYAHRRRTSSIRPHGYSYLNPRYCQIHAAATGSSGLTGDGATTAAAEALTRFNRKKKMDKIQQFLGDRVPEQDLWMGTIGREKTQEMLDKNLLSPTSSAFSQDGLGAVGVSGVGGAGLNRSAMGGSRLTPKFKKAAFPGRSKTTSVNTLQSQSKDPSNEKEKEKGDSSASERANKKTRPQPVVVTSGERTSGTVRMERSLSDPPRLEDGAGNGLWIQSPGVYQHPYQWHTTVSRLRQQLATSVLVPAPGAIAAAAIVDGIASRVSTSSRSPPMSPSTSFSSSSIASPRISLSSNTTSTGALTATSTSADASASSPTLPTNATAITTGYMAVIHDEEGDDSALDADSNDESAQILPRLRAMSGKDQELFLKRAEKLEKLFGHFPPSALLHRSLTTANASSSSATAMDGTTNDGGHERKEVGSNEGEEMVSVNRGGTSIVQLATFLASTTTSSCSTQAASTSPSSTPTSPAAIRRREEEEGGEKKWTSEMMEALAEVERASCSSFTSENNAGGVVESLRLSSPV
ncbi:hypothetical protein BGZ96_002101 [Linnemannia gamsii]|uniref:RGS domain-containing protein n=1 Tax=Linnemannia gamsii TaxID=64522 RepID=A0ABQ7JLP2_9FUNG|nr:hypothetical protein BGZ96_002101 [Linnemannia gamsii]